MSYIIKKLIIVLGIALILVPVYFLVVNSGANEMSRMSEEDSRELEQRSERILLDNRKIKALNIKSTLFNDVRFSSLVQTRMALPANIETGRADPFAPF